jgi:hypothetical protein
MKTEQIRATIDQLFHHQVQYTLRAFLYLAFRQKQTRTHHLFAETVKDVFPKNQICDAGLIAEGDKDGVAFAWTLSHQHHPGHPRPSPIGKRRQPSARGYLFGVQQRT